MGHGKTKIYYSIPWNTEKNLGVYYNDFMSKLNDNEFACFVDGDACFTVTFFGKQLEDIIEKYPECGLFTAMANRVGCIWQRAGDWNSNDIGVHRQIGQQLFNTKYDLITDVSSVHPLYVLSGHLIMIKKSLWEKLGKFNEKGILGIDNDIHWKAQAHNEKIYLMEGVYLYHWYRNGTEDLSHLI